MSDSRNNNGGSGSIVLAANADDDADAAFRRMIVASMSGSTMKRYAAAAAMVIAGRRGSELRAPEPLIQVGFEPREHEMPLIVDMAKAAGRDLIHVGCHDDGSGKPAGLIAIVYLENGVAHAHRRGGLLCCPGSTEVFLAGVCDEEDENWRFVLSPGRKMARVNGRLDCDLGDAMQRGGELWFAQAAKLEGVDCGNEVLRIPGVIQGPGGPAVPG